MHPVEPQDEMLQCYDDDGKPTVVLPRSEVKQRPYRYWYAVSRIWLVNHRGEILCTRRADTLAANPGKWQTYVGGHVGAGQTILETAVRELAEEAGVEARPEELKLIEQGRNDENKAFFESYAYRFTSEAIDLTKTDGEVSEQRWMTYDEYDEDRGKRAELWCNALHRWQYDKIMQWIR